MYSGVTINPSKQETQHAYLSLLFFPRHIVYRTFVILPVLNSSFIDTEKTSSGRIISFNSMTNNFELKFSWIWWPLFHREYAKFENKMPRTSPITFVNKKKKSSHFWVRHFKWERKRSFPGKDKVSLSKLLVRK